MPVAKPGALSDDLEGLGEVVRVDRRADRRGEHVARIPPGRAGCEALLELAPPVLTKRAHDRSWQVERSPRACGLQFSVDERAALAFHLGAHVDHGSIEVNVVPTKPEQLSTAKTEGQPDRDRRFETVAGSVRKELVRLFNAERPSLASLLPRGVGELDDVACVEAPPFGLPERLGEHTADHLDRSRRERLDLARSVLSRPSASGLELLRFLREESLDIQRGQLRDLSPAERRVDVALGQEAVARARAWRDSGLNDVLGPALDQCLDRDAIVAGR